MPAKPKVLYWNNIPSPYVVGRFNAIADRGNLSFSAIFDQEREPDRSWDVTPNSWRFAASYSREIPFLRRSLGEPPDLLVTLNYTPRFMLGSIGAKARGTRVAFRVLPTFDSWQRRSKVRESAKHIIYRVADSVKVPGPEGASVARRYGMPEERIFEVTQSIDVQHYAGAMRFRHEFRRAKRTDLGLHGTVFIYVGRIWNKKGIDTLIDAFALARREIADVSLLIIGDGVDEAAMRARAATIPGIVFAGFVQPSVLPEWYSLGDVFVFPTLGDPHGLVVEEAMAAGLPVISSSAAGDIERRLQWGTAGFVVPPSDPFQLSQRMVQLARDLPLRTKMAQAGSEIVRTRSHEHYAIDFEWFVERTLGLMPRYVRFPDWTALQLSRRFLNGRL